MGGKSVARIKPPVGHDHIQLGQLAAVRLYKRQLVGCEIVLQRHRTEFGLSGEAPHPVLNLFHGHVQSGGDHRHVLVQIAGIVPQQQRRERWVVIHQQPAFAVINLAARRQDRHRTNAVVFCLGIVFFAAGNLQLPQPGT